MLTKTCGPELIDFQTFNQETALHLAARRGNEAAAVALLRAGARVDLLDNKFRTPLMSSLFWQQNDAMVRLMVLAGASVNRVTGSSLAPLLMVVARNNLLLTRLMLEHGSVVVDLKNDDLNWTIIHSACQAGKWFSIFLSKDSFRM